MMIIYNALASFVVFSRVLCSLCIIRNNHQPYFAPIMIFNCTMTLPSSSAASCNLRSSKSTLITRANSTQSGHQYCASYFSTKGRETTNVFKQQTSMIYRYTRSIILNSVTLIFLFCVMADAAPAEVTKDKSTPLNVYVLQSNERHSIGDEQHAETLADVALMMDSESMINERSEETKQADADNNREAEQLNRAIVSLLSMLNPRSEQNTVPSQRVIKKSSMSRRSFEQSGSRRSIHPCRWKLCGAYRRFH